MFVQNGPSEFKSRRSIVFGKWGLLFFFLLDQYGSYFLVDHDFLKIVDFQITKFKLFL